MTTTDVTFNAQQVVANIDGSPGDLYDPPLEPRRHFCCSQRNHGPHPWTGQSCGETYTCPGWPLNDRERFRWAEKRLAEENAGVTDDWREE